MRPDNRACRGDSQIDLYYGALWVFIAVSFTVLILTNVCGR